MEIFELYDTARESAETQREMTDEEAELRNEDLREKQDSRRWIVHDCVSRRLDSILSRQLSKAVDETHIGSLNRILT